MHEKGELLYEPPLFLDELNFLQIFWSAIGGVICMR